MNRWDVARKLERLAEDVRRHFEIPHPPLSAPPGVYGRVYDETRAAIRNDDLRQLREEAGRSRLALEAREEWSAAIMRFMGLWPQCRALSPAAHRVLMILREPERYEPPYEAGRGRRGKQGTLEGPLVPITYLHYEASRLDGRAMDALRELEDRGIRLVWDIDPSLGARLRLA